jgi:hypothetical protein
VTTDRRAASPSRFTKNVCANADCNRKFRPVRADAEYCSNACKQSHYRARKKARAEADALFRVKQNTDNFEAHQRIAIDLYREVKGIEVIATNTGVLVAETTPGAREQAASRLPDWQQTPIQPEDVPSLLRLAPVPRYSETGEARRQRARQDFRYRMAERDFRAAMNKPAHSISLFTFDDDAQQAKLAASSSEWRKNRAIIAKTFVAAGILGSRVVAGWMPLKMTDPKPKISRRSIHRNGMDTMRFLLRISPT